MDRKLLPLAKNLRKRATDAESTLWNYLRTGKLEGLKFRRQQVIGKYIVDFVCFEKLLVVELDGGQHAEEAEADRARDAWLNREGYRVLRVWNHEVLTNLEGTLEMIRNHCQKLTQASN